MTIDFEVDGRPVSVPDDGGTLLEALRERLGIRSVKDGCAPQGQCGCCTVLVDGQPRVSCVTPVRRVAGRSITTVDGLPADRTERWADAFCATGASQCGFCTPGIIVRLDALRTKAAQAGRPADHAAVERSLAAHLCRCTGWRTILDAWDLVQDRGTIDPTRDLAAAGVRAGIEGGTSQRVGPDVALGLAGFADDLAPADSLVAVRDGDEVSTVASGWVIGGTLQEARARAAKVQGRRTTVGAEPPIAPPPGAWAVTLQTSWVEPAYLETDSSWCRPGGEPATPLANGGAFGAKSDGWIADAARTIAAERGRPVRVLLAREDAVRLGPKRPPLAAGLAHDGTGVVRVARTPGIADAIARVLPLVTVEEVDVPGPPTSAAIRGAGWVEAAVLAHALGPGDAAITGPSGGSATAEIDASGTVHVAVRCGDPLDRVVLRSYCIGAAHMALSWVTSESLAVDPRTGEILDLTIRSFGILRASDMPEVEVEILPDDGPPVNGSDAVFAAVAAAAWRRTAFAPRWPTGPG